MLKLKLFQSVAKNNFSVSYRIYNIEKQKISATSLKNEIEFSFHSEQRTVKLHKMIYSKGEKTKRNEIQRKWRKKALKTLMLFTAEKKMEVLES